MKPLTIIMHSGGAYSCLRDDGNAECFPIHIKAYRKYDNDSSLVVVKAGDLMNAGLTGLEFCINSDNPGAEDFLIRGDVFTLIDPNKGYIEAFDEFDELDKRLKEFNHEPDDDGIPF